MKMMMPGSKAWIHDVLASRWMRGFMARSDMRKKWGRALCAGGARLAPTGAKNPMISKWRAGLWEMEESV